MNMSIKDMLKSYIVPLAKLFLAPFFLWLIAKNVLCKYDIGLLKLDPLLILAAIIVNQIALSMFALRMYLMLGVFGVEITKLQSLRIHLQSVFYFFVLPMTVGLEAARFAKVKNIVGEGAKVVMLGSALLSDRLIGTLAASFLAIILLPFVNIKILAQLDMRMLFMVLVGGIVFLYLMTLHRTTRSYLRELVLLIRSGRRGLWVSIIVSISTHLFFSLGVYLAVMGVNLQITFLQTLFVVSASMLFVIVPVSFAGVSPVEAAGLGALLSFGVPMEHAVIFVLITYVAKLIAAFEGGGWEIYEGGEHISRHLFRERKDNA